MRHGIGIGVPLPPPLSGRAKVGAPVTPLSIFGGSASVLQWCRSDLGVVTSGANMVSWADQSGNGNHYNTMSATPPTYTASDASLGNRPTINFARATSQYMACPLNLPAPGTTPTWFAAVARYRTWTSGAVMFGADSALCMMLRMGPTAAPNLRIVNAFNGVTNNGLGLNEWGEVEGYFSNSTSDYSCLKGLMQPGANAGNTSATGRRIGGFTAAFADMDVAEIVYVNRLPSDAEIAAWLAYLGLP